jgi:hypothetical protein
MTDPNEETTFEYDSILQDTGKAFLLSTDAGEVWIPKSQVKYHDEESSEMTIPLWLAEERGLE